MKKLKPKKRLVSKRPLPPAKSTRLERDLKAIPSSAAQRPPKNISIHQQEFERLQHEFGRFQAAVDQIRRWGTDRGLDQASEILVATYRLLDLVELRNPEKKVKK